MESIIGQVMDSDCEHFDFIFIAWLAADPKQTFLKDLCQLQIAQNAFSEQGQSNLVLSL